MYSWESTGNQARFQKCHKTKVAHHGHLDTKTVFFIPKQESQMFSLGEILVNGPNPDTSVWTWQIWVLPKKNWIHILSFLFHEFTICSLLEIRVVNYRNFIHGSDSHEIFPHQKSLHSRTIIVNPKKFYANINLKETWKSKTNKTQLTSVHPFFFLFPRLLLSV